MGMGSEHAVACSTGSKLQFIFYYYQSKHYFSNLHEQVFIQNQWMVDPGLSSDREKIVDSIPVDHIGYAS